ncbi:hypothetical protein RRG08_039172 [Elysia crispata]|uniref:Uncharacterized protein n=1 Tax=Elysia crispata TaxID=231223 RepID=A0AAE1DE96_9GAST|nr:hypothetical protein RRG08_039172 [Elysia crispata]
MRRGRGETFTTRNKSFTSLKKIIPEKEKKKPVMRKQTSVISSDHLRISKVNAFREIRPFFSPYFWLLRNMENPPNRESHHSDLMTFTELPGLTDLLLFCFRLLHSYRDKEFS